MAYEIIKVDVWSKEIEDQPGAVAKALQPIVDAGANLQFLLARRIGEGKGILFISPIQGPQQIKKAKSEGFKKNDGIAVVKITGPDKPGLGLKILNAVYTGDVNLRGISAISIGKNCSIWLAFDTIKDANKAIKLIQKI